MARKKRKSIAKPTRAKSFEAETSPSELSDNQVQETISPTSKTKENLSKIAMRS